MKGMGMYLTGGRSKKRTHIGEGGGKYIPGLSLLCCMLYIPWQRYDAILYQWFMYL
jgi:hypothetical protein